jgi:hypothetical protein
MGQHRIGDIFDNGELFISHCEKVGHLSQDISPDEKIQNHDWQYHHQWQVESIPTESAS